MAESDGPKIVTAIPEPQWLRGDKGLLNLVFFSGIGLFTPRKDGDDWLVAAWEVRTGRMVPIRGAKSQKEAEDVLDFIAGTVGATILPEPSTTRTTSGQR